MTKRVLLVLFLVVTLAVLVKGQGTVGSEPDAKVRLEILNVEEEEKEATLKGDTEMLDRLYADDMVFTHPNGEFVTKAQVLAEYRTGIQKVHNFEHDDVRVRCYGDAVVVTGRSTTTYQYKGKEYVGAKRFTNVWVKKDGQWRLVVHHVTPVAKE